jgi:large subunit ribosomal protein L6
MSRIGKLIINIPEGVELKVDSLNVIAKGSLGELSINLPEGIGIKVNGKKIEIIRESEDKKIRSLHGLYRVLVQNLLVGVSAGFSKTLEFKGIGYRVAVNENILTLNVGYSHPVELKIPDNLKVTVKKSTIEISGIDKSKVGQFAADIRAVRKPEVYKGKGIRYTDEHIKIKPGKTAAKG